MFGLISMAVGLDAGLQSFSSERAGEIGGIIDKHHGISDALFLAQHGEKLSTWSGRYTSERADNAELRSL